MAGLNGENGRQLVQKYLPFNATANLGACTNRCKHKDLVHIKKHNSRVQPHTARPRQEITGAATPEAQKQEKRSTRHGYNSDSESLGKPLVRSGQN